MGLNAHRSRLISEVSAFSSVTVLSFDPIRVRALCVEEPSSIVLAMVQHLTHNAQRTTHNAQRTTHNAQRTTHNAQRTTHNAQRTTHNAQRTTHNAQRTTHNAQRTTHNAQRTTHNAQRTTHNAQRTTHNAQRTTHNAQCLCCRAANYNNRTFSAELYIYCSRDTYDRFIIDKRE